MVTKLFLDTLQAHSADAGIAISGAQDSIDSVDSVVSVDSIDSIDSF